MWGFGLRALLSLSLTELPHKLRLQRGRLEIRQHVYRSRIEEMESRSLDYSTKRVSRLGLQKPRQISEAYPKNTDQLLTHTRSNNLDPADM